MRKGNYYNNYSSQKRSRGIFKRFLRFLALACCLFLLIALGLAILSKYVNPSDYPFLTIWGLLYPLIALTSCLAMCWWLFRKRWLLAALLLLGILFTLPTLLHTFPIHFSSGNYRDASLSVMSYNVRVFDRYQWSADSLGGEKILSLIEDHSPDILCLQEFGLSSRSGVNKDKVMQSFRSYPYQYIVFDNISQTNAINKQGLAIFSRYKLGNKHVVGVNSKGKYAIACDAYIANDTVRIYNIHLNSINLPPFNSGQNLIRQLLSLECEEKRKYVSQITQSLKDAAVIRSKQVDIIQASMATYQGTSIVCGDFNAPPCSYAYHQVKSKLKDAYVSRGLGQGSTFHGKYPASRIDYILHSKTYETLFFKRIAKGMSDHYPIMAYLRKRKQ